MSEALPPDAATPVPPPLSEVIAAIEHANGTPASTEPSPSRDEATELVDRRVDVPATQADRLKRMTEAPAPVRSGDAPTRLELRSVEDRVEANRLRTETLSRQLAELTEAETRAADARVHDRGAIAELTTTRARLEERLRDLAEEVADLRQSSAAANEAVNALRNTLTSRESVHASALARQIAGAYTLAVVALLAAILTLTLLLAR